MRSRSNKLIIYIIKLSRMLTICVVHCVVSIKLSAKARLFKLLKATCVRHKSGGLPPRSEPKGQGKHWM